jgi:excinuclease ABC subunit B
LGSVYERDHVQVTVEGFAEEGEAFIGHNIRAHIEHLEKKMREAAADLEFETAARIRDEVKRLQATELAVADDPFARAEDISVELEGPALDRSNAPRLSGKTASGVSRKPRSTAGKTGTRNWNKRRRGP